MRGYSHTNHIPAGHLEKINVQDASDTDNFPILMTEVIAAVASLKKGKATGVDNIQSVLLQAGGDTVKTMSELRRIGLISHPNNDPT
jgi:hypothetical protein